MTINHRPPDDRPYIMYPSPVVWTRYRGWYPVTRVQREAFVVLPWEVNDSENDAQLSCGMQNAYCIVAKWHHEVPNPRRQFEPIGHAKNSIPGCLHLATNLDCVTQRCWTFRSTVALKIAEALSKPSLAAATKFSINLDGISNSLWENFKQRTIPLEKTERKGVLTKRTIRKNLAIEMLRGPTTKHFWRFDTPLTMEMLKGYFGLGIQGAGRIRRFKGPKFSRRTGPSPAIRAKRLLVGDSVGAIIRLPEEPTKKYYSTKPGVDIIYHPAKRQFTIRVRFIIEGLSNPQVREQLLGLNPLPPVPSNDASHSFSVVPGETNFEHQGTLFVVKDFTIDGEEGVCEVVETQTPEDFIVGAQINFPIALVEQASKQYNSLDCESDDEDEDEDEEDDDDDDDDDHDDD